MARGRSAAEERPKGKLSAKGVREVLGLLRYLYPYRLAFGLGLLFLVASSLTTLAFPQLIGELLNSAMAGGPTAVANFENLNRTGLLLLGILVLQAVFSFCRILLFVSVGERAMADLRRDLFGHLLYLPMPFFNRSRVGELTSRLSSDISLIQDTFTTTVAELLRGTVHILVGVGLLVYISGTLTLVMLATFPVVIVVAMVFGRYIRKLARRGQDKLAEATTVVEESLQGIQNVKAYTNEPFELSRYSKALSEAVRLALRGSWYRGGFSSFIIFALFGAIVLVIWQGAHLVQRGELTLGDLTKFLLYTMFVGGAIGSLGEMVTQLIRTIGATERVRELLAEPSEPKAPAPASPRLSGAIRFDDVSFTYPTRAEVPVLRSVSFAVQPGEKVALVGPSGAGKSTLVALLLRFFEPDSGTLWIDDRPAHTYPVGELRGHMAVVPQEVLLFGGTIRENIAYGKLEATEAEIIDAAQQANAWQFIQSFPEGLDAVVGDRGVKLSGGQRQRIAIARAVLRNPSILLLDEATSSLDAESERLVQEALEKLMEGRTTFIIAHRLATVRSVNHIVVLDRGQIVEQGTHQSLMAVPGGLYQSLAKLQFDQPAALPHPN
ncbi:MAG: ABC transporter transmembrane domain-containing protein [Bacteroidia bacterium]|nr:ABC transporter transmembrane domain-containing protein [Bacteroidia bacterium]